MTFSNFDDINNQNGQILANKMTYEDLEQELYYDRSEMIEIIASSRMESLLDGGNLILDVLIELHDVNNIKHPPEYYLQGDEFLRKEYCDAVYSFYDSMTNEEIVNWFKENEPLVFSMHLEFEKLL